MFFFRVLLTLTVIEKVALGSEAGVDFFSNQYRKSELIILVKSPYDIYFVKIKIFD